MAITSAELSLEIPIGRDFRKKFTMKVDSVPVNLSTYSIKSQIREKKPAYADLIVEFTVHVYDQLHADFLVAVDDGYTGTEIEWLESQGIYDLYDPDADNEGTFWLELLDTASTGITKTTGYYDVVITNQHEWDETYIEGDIIFRPLPTVKNNG